MFGEEAKLRWNEIAPLVPNRTEPKCRERWFNAFDTRRSRLPFSEEEDVRLVGMVSDWLQQQLRERAVQGNARRSSRPPTIPWMAWTDHFPGRASVEIKNRYNTIRVVRRLPSVREVLQSGGQMMADDNSASKS